MRALVLALAGLVVAAAAIAGGFLYFAGLTSTLPAGVGELPATGGGPGRARHVVVIVLDGARRDAFERLATTRPALAALRARAAIFEGHSGHPSLSRPMYATLASGASPRLHGVATNGRKGPARVDTLFASARRLGRDVLLRDDRTSFWWDLFSSPKDERIESVAALRERLGHATRAFAYVHVLDADDAAHGHGAASAEYEAALARDASAVEAVAASLDLARDALVITADHGHRNRGGHGGQEPEVVDVPLWVVGRGVVAGTYGAARAVDVAPTVALLAGLPFPAHGEGRPLFEGLDLGSGGEDGAAQSWLSQRWRLTNALLGGLGKTLIVPPRIPDGALAAPTARALVETYEERVDAAFGERVSRERSLRVLVAVAVFLACALFAWRRRLGVFALGLGALPMAGMLGVFALVLPFSVSAIRQKVEFYFHAALIASVVADLAALAAWWLGRRLARPRLLRETGEATLLFCALELAVLFAAYGLSFASDLPPPEGFILPALALTRLAVSAILWAILVPALARWRRARGKGTPRVLG